MPLSHPGSGGIPVYDEREEDVDAVHSVTTMITRFRGAALLISRISDLGTLAVNLGTTTDGDDIVGCNDETLSVEEDCKT